MSKHLKGALTRTSFHVLIYILFDLLLRQLPGSGLYYVLCFIVLIATDLIYHSVKQK